MRVILYGFGKVWKKEYGHLDDYEIVAVADQRACDIAKEKSNECNFPMILPEEISEYKYDFIAISSPTHYESIKQQLICENAIPQDKIISMQLLLKEEYKKTPNDDERNYLKSIFGNDVRVETKPGEKRENEVRYSSVYFDIYVNKKNLPKSEEIENPDSIMYVITHKDYSFQPHPGYTPICVGGFLKDGFLSDKEGKSIAPLNDRINEMTAIYWVWKNRPSEVVGFSHYRRFFYDNDFSCFENWLRLDTAKKYLDEFDIILCRRIFDTEMTVEDELRIPLSEKAYEKGYQIILNKLMEYQPDYVDEFNSVLIGKSCCYYNMFVTTWEVFDRFATWLFSFLIPAVESFPVEQFSGEDRRTIGFFAERMLTVWLCHNPLKEKNLPVYLP